MIDIIGTLRRLVTSAAAILVDTARLAGTEATGTHAHADNTNWQNVATITTGTRHKLHAILMDFVNLTQNTNMRIQIEIDGATARTIWQDAWLVTDDDGILIDIPRAINTDFTLDIQSQVAEGAAKDVLYNIIYEEME